MKEWGLLVLALSALPLAASAQDRGRTDGPEGSEYGKGGYARAGDGSFALVAEFGSAWTPTGPLGGVVQGPPLSFGVTAVGWLQDWVFLEASGTYLANSGRVNLLLGPRLRTGTEPFGASVAVKAGTILVPGLGPDGGMGLRFGVSPQVSGDLLVGNHVLLQLSYALDLALGGDAGLSHRVFMGAGYRF